MSSNAITHTFWNISFVVCKQALLNASVLMPIARWRRQQAFDTHVVLLPDKLQKRLPGALCWFRSIPLRVDLHQLLRHCSVYEPVSNTYTDRLLNKSATTVKEFSRKHFVFAICFCHMFKHYLNSLTSRVRQSFVSLCLCPFASALASIAPHSQSTYYIAQKFPSHFSSARWSF